MLNGMNLNIFTFHLFMKIPAAFITNILLLTVRKIIQQFYLVT